MYKLQEETIDTMDVTRWKVAVDMDTMNRSFFDGSMRSQDMTRHATTRRHDVMDRAGSENMARYDGSFPACYGRAKAVCSMPVLYSTECIFCTSRRQCLW